MSSRTIRTYSRRSRTAPSSSSPPPEDSAPEPPTSSPCSTPPPSPIPKRSLSDTLGFPPPKKPRLLKPDAKKSKHPPASSSKWKPNPKKQPLIQLHFSIDASVLRTCPICDLSYTKGTQDDEALHKSHCARVQRGLEWGADEIRESAKHGVVEIESGIRLKDGSLGRILAVNANVSGKIGSKLTALFETITVTLSSPPLTRQTLADSKAYLFLLAPSVPNLAKSTSASSGSKLSVRKREKIVGCVVAQPIATAMCIIEFANTPGQELPTKTECDPSPQNARQGDDRETHVNGSNEAPHQSSTSHRSSRGDLITVDASTSLYCSPEPLPTPLGIPRMFVSSSYRRLGIASRLLTAAAENFIHGITLDPAKGEVAFTQPTASGKALMEKWGGKGARVYRE